MQVIVTTDKVRTLHADHHEECSMSVTRYNYILARHFYVFIISCYPVCQSGVTGNRCISKPFVTILALLRTFGGVSHLWHETSHVSLRAKRISTNHQNGEKWTKPTKAMARLTRILYKSLLRTKNRSAMHTRGIYINARFIFGEGDLRAKGVT